MLKFKTRLTVIIVALLALLITSSTPAIAVSPTVTFTPTEITSVLNNPYMGWAPWASGGPYQQPHSLVYINVTWRELEPTKGNYDFNTLESENKFNYWAQNGKKIILRINMDYPASTSHKDIPDWLFNEIDGDGTWYNLDWGMGFSPNYDNTKLIAYHKALIEALGNRYNNNNLIPIIAVGSLGAWGEFHHKKDSTMSIPFPKESVSDQYVQPYIDNFSNKILVMRRPFQIAKDNGMGLFNDSFGSTSQTYNYFNDFINYGYNDYLTGENHPAMPDYWKTAPSGGEISSYPGNEYLQDSTVAASIQMLKDSHTSWLGPCSPGFQPTGTSLQNNFDQMLTTMGYRYVVSSVSHESSINAGSDLNITMDWANKGVAPFYYNWPLELSLADAAGNIVSKVTSSKDIRTWLPGNISITESINIPSSLPAGNYTLCVGIIDPDTGLPGIDLAISGRRADGRYSLSQVTVEQPSKVTSIEITGSTYIEVPKTGIIASDYTASIKDQYLSIMTNETVRWSLNAPVEGVTINEQTGKIIVGISAKPVNAVLTATSTSNGNITANKDLILYIKPVPVVTTVEIVGSTYIKIPTNGVTYSDYTAIIKDQNSLVMASEAVTWSLNASFTGITLNSSTGKISVSTNAKATTATLTAISKSTGTIKAVKSLNFIK